LRIPLSKSRPTNRSVWLLNLVLGLVLCAYSVDLIWEQLHGMHREHASHFHLGLGLAEAIAAFLFLIWQKPAGMVLLFTFVVAALFHLLSGQIGSLGVLAIYFAAVLTVMSNT
jgi:NhaP-type Na+/H+ and K+/H+ antiporter